MQAKDPYLVLGLKNDATQEQVENAYRALRRKYEELRFREGEEGAQASRALGELDRAYADCMEDLQRRVSVTESGSSLGSVEELIKQGKLDEAQEKLDLVDRVDFLVSSEEAGMDKPGAPIFWLALQKCGCTADEAIMVGDNFRHDVQGALDRGIGGIWLNWGGRPTPEDERPYFEAKSFQHAADYIRTLL